MIYRLTNKMAKKIKESPDSTLEPPNNPFLDWAADLFIAERTHYILLTHCRSLLSCVAYAKGINNYDAFIRIANQSIKDCLSVYEYEFIFESLVAPQMGNVIFSKVGNRKVNGVMVDLVKHAKYYLSVDELSPLEITQRLNKIPQCSRKNPWPIKAFSELPVSQEN